MSKFFHRFMRWLFPEISPPYVPQTTHRAEDVPGLVKKGKP